MHRLTLLAIALTLLVVTVPIVVAFADVSVGVKKGDWIEYQVTVTGNPPEDHNLTWARMEVTDVQDAAISLDIQTKFASGIILPEHITLNLASGVLGDDFFIPANLSAGDVFYDAHAGNIIITGSEQRTYAGAERTVVTGHTNVTSFYWDQQTGILVEAYSNYSDINFTMKTVADKTNIWQPQPTVLAPSLGYAASVVAVAVVVVVALLLLRARSRRKRAL